MKNAGKARSYGLYRHLRTSKEIIENLLNYYNTFYGRSGWQGVGQAKAVVFFIIVALLASLQLRVTGQREAHGV